MTHADARPTFHGRRLPVRRVVQDPRPVPERAVRSSAAVSGRPASSVQARPNRRARYSSKVTSPTARSGARCAPVRKAR
ncbi:leucine zipper domain-containing protein [Streptomyces sp. NPDC042638]|uniref:leucine zipper domain-containing protein n=1 Tax=Streptomyces sp. NPDC042638 TaxID=3154333 RepID=UPI0033FD948C